MRPVAGDKRDAGRDGIGGMAEPGRLPVDREVPPGRRMEAREDIEKLVLSLTFQSDHAQDLARSQVEGHVAQAPAVAHARHRQARGDAVRRGGRGGTAASGLQPRAQHQLDDLLLDAGTHRHVADGDAVAQDAGPVAQLGDLREAVRDVDDRAPLGRLLAHDPQHVGHQIGGQRRRHLVQQQHMGLGRQCARQVEDPQRRQRQGGGTGIQPQVVRAQFGRPVPERVDRRAAKPQVVRDVEVGDQRRLLIYRDQPRPAGLRGRGDGGLRPCDPNLARVGPQRARQDLDEGGLARAVGAHQRHDLARGDAQGSVAQGGHRAEALGNAGRVQDRRRVPGARGRHRHAPHGRGPRAVRGPPVRAGIIRPAPCSR